MIQMQDIDDSFIENNKDFLEEVQDAIKVGVSANLPAGLSGEPELLTRFKLIEKEVLGRFEEAQTMLFIPGIVIQFLFPSMESLITCILTNMEGDKHFNLGLIKLEYKKTFSLR